MTITLPPIDPRLHAHNKGGWRAKATAVKQLRHFAYLVGKSLVTRSKAGSCRYQIRYRFYVPNRRRADSANMVQSQKPAIDGLVDSGLIPGDHWEVLVLGGVTVEVDSANPRVVLEITEVRE